MDTLNALVFDLYGTLYDVHSVAPACDRVAPGRGAELSRLWRQKQLEYTWLRSLMDQYVDFERATSDALRHVCRHLGLDLHEAQHAALCDAYLALQPFPEVPAALTALQARGLPLAILSNGSPHSITSVVQRSGQAERFAHLISVDAVRCFKPRRPVYELAERQLGLDRSRILFVSSNAWDATGAAYFGYPTCWVNRSGGTFEEMGQRPCLTVHGLDELVAWFDEPAGLEA